tara:strand:+ start:46771 stop:47820 length:1050 start_codon:yes stop_codon:yes gene_type:complete
MNEEMDLPFNKTRFLWRGFYYPLHFVLFEDPNKLGYFSPSHFQIGLHKKLMYLAHDKVIENIIRHELAHMYCSLLYGKRFHELDSHGKEFREVCARFSWGPEVFKAYSHLEFENELYRNDKDIGFERIKGKIEKLLALADSDNPHEAQAATLKANQLLLKYNLKNLDFNEEAETCVKLVYRTKKLNSTMNALYDILQYFYVQPVFNRTGEGVGLDVVGSRLNVEMADYITKYLANEFETLWNTAKKKDPKLKGLKMKNNYILGLAQGFSTKLKQERSLQNQEASSSRDLIRLNDNLLKQVKMAFPRLSRQAASAGSFDPRARASGQKDGSQINIRPGVSQGNKGFLLNS